MNSIISDRTLKNLLTKSEESPLIRISYQSRGDSKSAGFQSPQEIQADCPSCGNHKGKIGAGKKPGESSLICDNCGKFIKWLSAKEFKKLYGKKRKKPKIPKGKGNWKAIDSLSPDSPLAQEISVRLWYFSIILEKYKFSGKSALFLLSLTGGVA